MQNDNVLGKEELSWEDIGCGLFQKLRSLLAQTGLHSRRVR